jgi:hypothetical protein
VVDFSFRVKKMHIMDENWQVLFYLSRRILLLLSLNGFRVAFGDYSVALAALVS